MFTLHVDRVCGWCRIKTCDKLNNLLLTLSADTRHCYLYVKTRHWKFVFCVTVLRTVLESACPEDSKTPPTCSLWWSFVGDVWSWRQLIPFQNFTSFHLFGIKFSFQKSRLVFNLEHLWQIFIKFNNQGQLWNPHDK